jgi:hypothetical protein
MQYVPVEHTTMRFDTTGNVARKIIRSLLIGCLMFSGLSLEASEKTSVDNPSGFARKFEAIKRVCAEAKAPAPASAGHDKMMKKPDEPLLKRGSHAICKNCERI